MVSATSLPWLAWMSGTVLVYWLTPERWRDLSLIGISLAFLATYSPESATLILLFTVVTFMASGRGHVATWRLLGAALFIIAVLVFYKLRVAGDRFGWISSVAIPLGLSYYSFRCLHYLIERYKGVVSSRGFRELAGYLLFLPTLSVGPIHRFPGYLREANRLRWDAAKFSQGLLRILYGYFKITVLAVFLVSEQLGEEVQLIANSHPWLSTYLLVIERALYGYLLFAGYSDIAIGFSLLLGFTIIENFNWPFLRKNISEFWQSWHISLSSWVREYIYMTVVATTRKPALAAVASMVIFGLWHEISARYVAWGIYHAAGIAAWQWFQGWKARMPVPRHGIWSRTWVILSTLLTFHFVVLSFVLVNEPDLRTALSVYMRLLLLLD